LIDGPWAIAYYLSSSVLARRQQIALTVDTTYLDGALQALEIAGLRVITCAPVPDPRGRGMDPAFLVVAVRMEGVMMATVPQERTDRAIEVVQKDVASGNPNAVDRLVLAALEALRDEIRGVVPQIVREAQTQVLEARNRRMHAEDPSDPHE